MQGCRTPPPPPSLANWASTQQDHQSPPRTPLTSSWTATSLDKFIQTTLHWTPKLGDWAVVLDAPGLLGAKCDDGSTSMARAEGISLCWCADTTPPHYQFRPLSYALSNKHPWEGPSASASSFYGDVFQLSCYLNDRSFIVALDTSRPERAIHVACPVQELNALTSSLSDTWASAAGAPSSRELSRTSPIGAHQCIEMDPPEAC